MSSDSVFQGDRPLPPYGIMDTDYLRSLQTKPGAPPDWYRRDGQDGTARSDQWFEWRDETVRMISAVLWPQWDPTTSSWSGNTACSKMLELTGIDLRLLMKVRVKSGVLPFDMVPSSTPRALNCPPHSKFFKEEDSGKIFTLYALYDRTLDVTMPAILGDIFFSGLDAKCGSTQLQLKQRFQRPRAYQTAFLFGLTHFTWEEATSSMTPSMVSGHALQGLMGVGAVMEKIITLGLHLNTDSWQSLRQYAVDIGDRRVMAGVHYPSDNLGSWLTAMRLADHVFYLPKVKEHLWLAIQEQSIVYRWIVDSGEDIYQAALCELEKAAGS